MDIHEDEAALRRLEQELNYEILPGTEVMKDVGDFHFVQGKEVLVPQPSADPADPLNWSPLWKALTTIAASSVTFSQGMGPLALAPTFPLLMKEWNRDLDDVVKFTGYTILVLGFSNFVWVPLSSTFGRRPVLIASQCICLAASIWHAKATSYDSFMASWYLNGIGAGPAETIQPAVIADIYFLHERGFWNTLYWVVYMGSLMIAPVISGSMSYHLGWRDFWWLNTAVIALSLILVIFTFPETKWHRVQPQATAPIPRPASDSEKSFEKGKAEKSEDVSGAVVAEASDATRTELTSSDPYLGIGKPTKSQFGLFSPNPDPWKAVTNDIWIPWKLFAFPIVEFASFVVSWSCSCFLAVNLTQSRFFGAPPYLWNTEHVGFTNLAIFVGAMIGLLVAGPFSDWVTARATKRNGGIREPEMRLPAMIPFILLNMTGTLVAAYGMQNQWSWQPIVIVGYACLGIQVAALPAMAQTYAVDSYKPVAGSIMVAVTVNKNVWGYGFSRFLNEWITEIGYVGPLACNMALCVLWCSFGILFYFKGKTFRRWTAKSSVHRQEW